MFNEAKAHVIEALLVSPVAKEAEARHAKATAARRAELAQERSAIERQAFEQFDPYYQAQARAFEECQTAELALNAAKAKLGAMIANRAVEIQRQTIRTAAIEAELRNSADPVIGQFIVYMHREWERALRTQPEPEVTAVRNVNTGRVTQVPTVRRVKPFDRVQAIRQAISAAEALQLEADHAGVAAKLDALCNGLPVIGAELKGVA